MNRMKKVRFLDPVSAPTENFQSPSVGDAKTSEYKCFKKLLGENNRKCRFNQSHKDDNNFKAFEVVNFHQDKNDLGTCVSDAKRSMFPIQSVAPTAQMSLSARIEKSFELDNQIKYKHNTCNSLTPIQKVVSDSWMSSLSPGPKNEYEGIFSKKRKDLLHMAAETSSHVLDEILSNKSDLILEYLQRLGVGQKAGSFDELSKPVKKVSSGGCHSPASLKSYGETNELQVTVRENVQPEMGRQWETGLLNRSCSEADELIALPVHQAFPNSHALEANFQSKKWRPIPVSDDKRKLNLYTQNKTSTADRAWCKATGQILTKGDEIVTLPHDYCVINAFPSSNALDSGLRGIKWHLNPTLGDEKFFENTSAYIGYGAMSYMLPPKMNEFTSLPSDVMLRPLPARHAIESDIEFEYRNEFSSKDHMLLKFDYGMPDNFPSKGQFKEQSAAPYSNPTLSYDISGQDMHLELANKQCTIPLLECPKEHPKGLDCLPLGVYDAPDFFESTGLVSIDVYERKNSFSSLPCSYLLSTPISKNLQREHCWSVHTAHEFDEEEADGGLGCIDTRSKVEDRINFMDVGIHFPDEYLSMGRQFSMGRERSIFTSFPDQSSWNCP